MGAPPKTSLADTLMKFWPIFAFAVAYAVSGIWWASDLSRHVKSLEQQMEIRVVALEKKREIDDAQTALRDVQIATLVARVDLTLDEVRRIRTVLERRMGALDLVRPEAARAEVGGGG